MGTIIFASNNQNKVNEIKAILEGNFDIVSLKEGGIDIDIPEPYDTLEENAREKSRTIYALTGKDCFSEDTGLEVEALNNEPGVRSARYAGDHDAKKNTEKLLENLAGIEQRQARFRTIVSLILSGEEHLFEGICEGKIIHQEQGTNGFGYDPVFIPDGSDKTFAEMDMTEKNQFSHRKKAIAKLSIFLKQQHGQD